ncbi:cell division protein FtsQ, partial [bacterium]|nr:cell division protein FtsQ [bacterium]
VQRPADDRAPGAVLIRGTVPNDIRDIVKTAANMGDALDSIEWIEGRRWNLYTTGGVTVMLPQADATAAISTLMILDKNHGILGRDLRVIDMRDPARILVK